MVRADPRFAPLPASITKDRVQRLRPQLKNELRALFADGGIRHRFEGDRVMVKAEHRDLFYARSLRTGAGGLRADVENLLSRDSVSLDIREGLREFLTNSVAELPTRSRVVDLWMTTLFADDKVEAVRALAEQDNLALYRLGMHQGGWRRLALWRIFEQLAGGVEPEDFHTLTPPDDAVLGGLLEVAPATLVCAPLLARFQPLAVVFEMHNLSQVVALPREGGGFVRSLHLPEWPVGAGHVSVMGSGSGLYKTPFRSFSPGDVERLLEQLVVGSNGLVCALTDPAHWLDADGVVDLDERRIAWASLQFGLDALGALATGWTDRESLWSAFRAVGILHGVWEGMAPGSVPFVEMFDPDRLRSQVLPALPVASYREWADGVLGNYERSLDDAFPSRQEGLQAIVELRHLLHGVGARPKDRGRRLEALRTLAREQPAVPLVRDVAVLWWAGVILAGERFFRTGQPPWLTSEGR